MSKFSASDVAFVGFRLVREHPRTVAIWAAAMTVLSLSVSALTIQLAGPQLAEFMAMSSETNPEPAAVLGIMKGLAPAMLLSIVYSLALYAVMLAAVNRMIQRPADDRSAYLRLGQDEVQQGITLILVNLLLLGLYLCAAVAYGVLLAIGFAALVTPRFTAFAQPPAEGAVDLTKPDSARAKLDALNDANGKLDGGGHDALGWNDHEMAGLSSEINAMMAELPAEEREVIALFISASMEGQTVFAGYEKPFELRMPKLEAIAIRAFLDLVRNYRPVSAKI